MADPAGGAREASEESHHSPHKESFWALALGSMGVVFGDIGTSPLYAMREALRHTPRDGRPELAVLGVVSLVALGADPDRHGQVRRLPDAGRQQGRGRHAGADGAGAARRRPARSGCGLRAGRGRRGAVLRRRHHHPGHLGAVGGRGPARRAGRRRTRSASYVLPIAAGHPDRAVHGAGARARPAWPRFFGPIMRAVVPGPGGAGRLPHRRRPVDLPGASPHYGVDLPDRQRLPRLRHPGQRLPGGDRGRGALRRHGPLREAARSARPGWCFVLPAPAAELPGPGRAGAAPPGGARRPVLPDDPGRSSTGRCCCWPPPPRSSPARR